MTVTRLWPIALRLTLLLMGVVVASWGAHLIRDTLTLDTDIWTDRARFWAILLGTLAYIVLLALPFVPGAEIGMALLTVFGANVALLVYLATVAALMLAFAVGRQIPVTALVPHLTLFHLRRSADLVARLGPLPPAERLALLMSGASPRLMTLALRHRYVALALSVNLPGNALLGGGGGILLVAGLSGLFAPRPTLVALLVAVSPVPLAVFLMGG